MTIYELTDQYRQLLELAEDPDTDITVFRDTLEALDGEIEIKAEYYGRVIRELEGRAASLDAEIERMTKLKVAAKRSIMWMKEALQFAMEGTGKTKIKTDHFAFTIATNGGKQPMYVSDKIDDIPEEFRTYPEPVADKEKIRAALEAGQELKFAELQERGRSLRIR
jgi:hypothetical protein